MPATTADEQYALGLAAFRRREFTEAERCARSALSVDAQYADAWQLLGVTAYEYGLFDVAAEHLVRAVELDALKAEYRYNLALAYAGGSRDDLAIDNYRTAVRLDPRHRAAWGNLANELRSAARIDESVDALRESIAIFPTDARLRVQLARSLRDQGRVREGYDEALRAADLAPDDPSITSVPLFLRQYVPGTTAAELLAEHRAWNARQPTFAPLFDGNAPDHRNDDGLRLGFVSPDLGYHPVGLFLAPVLDHLPDDARAFCYSHRREIDDQSRRLAGRSTFLDVRGLDDDELARRIRDDGIDVLFDLAGHTDDNRLPVFARRPAPLQVTWAGYVGTTGFGAIDALLADRFHVPEGAEGLYSERVLRMPHGYVWYEPPAYAPPVLAGRPYRDGNRVTFGCFNNASKVNDAVLAVWSRILAAVPASRLVLKYAGCDQPEFRKRATAAMAHEGVDRDRLEFLGRTTHVEHLRRLGRIDVALDPFPYSGGLSTLEAVWMGVPVVTCPGDTFASRHSLSHLSNAGADGTIAFDLDDYVRIAAELANDPERLIREHATLRERMAASPVCDAAGFVRDLLALLRPLVR